MPELTSHQLSHSDFSSGVIDNSEGVLKCVNSLYSNSELSDVVFVVGEERIHAHRLLLAARSEYFRSMLYGGLKESIEDEVVLSGTDPAAFTALLRYLYTGRLSIRRVEHKQLVDILCLAHEYQLKCIQDDLVAYFKRTLNIRNYFLTLNTAMMLSIDNLTERCLKFADYNCHDVLNSQDFNALPLKTLTRMLSRDTFCAPELDIFNALCRWAEYETKIGGTALEMLLNGLISKGCLRLALIDVDDLLNVVRSSILFSSNADIFDKYILDAISNKRNETKINFRGTLIRDTNIVTVEHGASVMVGIEPDALLSSNEKSGATRHKFGSQEGIVIDLGKPYTINTVVLKLNESDTKRTFSYYIEVSMDRKSWVMVADRTKYQCRSLQTLYFHPCLVRYIRVVGTACSASIQEFLLMGMEGLFSTTPSKVNSETTLIVPSANIAIAENNVRVIEGSGKVDFFNGKFDRTRVTRYNFIGVPNEELIT
ncbi:hypothetical protein Q1695_015683 [Nippostrongylus brasiliensis]|nr:hypothetical protein Q1695_015683 [Nippostrongylus brasiliensis]